MVIQLPLLMDTDETGLLLQTNLEIQPVPYPACVLQSRYFPLFQSIPSLIYFPLMKKFIIWMSGWAVCAVVFSFNREAAVVAVPLMIFILSFVTERDKVWVWIPAFAIGWIWVFIARGAYTGYNSLNYSVFGISVFPIVAWPSMLAGMYFLVFVRITGRNRGLNWLKFFASFSFFLILAEYIGYNIVGLKLTSGAAYPGWPVLNIFHSPRWMQAGYFANGLVFSGITALFHDSRWARRRNTSGGSFRL